jgi:uncharacterized protein
MLFKSRQRLTVLERVRYGVWPRVSFARSARYTIKRMMRLQATPHAIAVGCAAGVFASVTPLIGVQMAMAGAIALILRGSFAAAMLGTLFGNPFSWPLIWGATYALGTAMIGQPGSAEAASLVRGNEYIWPILYPMLLGSIPIGLVSAAVSYGVVAKTFDVLRCRRKDGFGRLTERLATLAAPAWRLW